ncbi:14349_t:CDS:1, partial [Gigaspora rosea]
KISLRKRILRRNIEKSMPSNFEEQLALCYEDLDYTPAVLKKLPLFFEQASFFIKENNISVQCYLHVGDIVLINSDEEECIAIIRAIFCHKK